LEEALDYVQSIVKAERLKRSRQTGLTDYVSALRAGR
jgi:hypothetical protein